MKKFFIIMLSVFILTGTTCLAQAMDRNAKVISFSGDVKVTKAGEAGAVRCRMGQSLKSGDKITTGRNSYIKIAFDRLKGNVIKIKEGSRTVVMLKGDDKVELVDGELITLLKNLKKGESFQIRTPGAVCGARGTGWVTKTTGRITDVTVFDGTVFVRGINRDGSVMKDEYLTERGFRRKIKKFERPQKKKKVPESKLLKIEEEMKLSRKVQKMLERKRKENKNRLREKMEAKILASISNKLDSRAICRAERFLDRHMDISPVKMDVMDMRTQMKMERKTDDRNQCDRIDKK